MAVRIDETLGYHENLFEAPLTWQCGQTNLGNTCYANSLLVAVAAVPALRSWVLKHDSLHEAYNYTNCLLCRVASDVSLLAASPCQQCISPATVETRASWCPQFANDQQQDVGDFWTKLADLCDAVDRNSYKDLVGDIYGSSALLYTTPYWTRCGWRGYTHTTCLRCGLSIKNHAFEDKLCLSFPRGGTPCRLKDSLRLHFSEELLPPPDKCEAGHCKHVGCRKKVTVSELWPEVLCIQLKRWIRTDTLAPYVKETRPMDIPCVLDNFEGGPDFQYVLYSAIIHQGLAGAGHYVTLFRSDPSGSWMLANDSSVAVYAGDVQAELNKAFMLFYMRAL